MSAPRPEDRCDGPPSSPASAGLTPAADTLATHGQAVPTPAGDGEVPPTRLPSLPTPGVAESIGWAEAGLPRCFGDYELLEEIAHGGMGIVYKARQQIGGGTRLVALKMMRAGGQASPAVVERFLIEARAAATLEHPHIVPIYDVGAVDGQHYFTMQLMPGGSLQQRLADGPLPPLDAARLVQGVAEAVQHAHEHGIIHRDIKPHNILLASGGCEPLADDGTGGSHPPLAGATPKLADFGLVRTRESGLSVTGEALGTPSYMPPEQARGELRHIGAPSDVYGLGAVLYALVTGRPPFQSADMFQTMRQVCEEEPLPPRQLNPAVPRDLETVCLKCLEKEPARRYASAAELAEELRRFERGEPVQARPVGRVERGWRWCRRNPAVAGLLAAVVLSLTAGACLSTALAVWATRSAHDAEARAEQASRAEATAERKAKDEKDARERADNFRRQAEDNERRARQAEDERQARYRVEYTTQITLAEQARQGGDLFGARRTLDGTRRESRGWEYGYLYGLLNAPQRTLWGHTAGVSSVAFSPDGLRLASATGQVYRPGDIKVWEVRTGQEVLSLKGHASRVESVCFSPDGKVLASGSGDQTIKLWDTRTGHELRTFRGHRNYVSSVCFRPDGKQLASASADGTVKVWDTQTGKELRTLEGHQAVVKSVCFSPDGKQLASGGNDRTVRLWDLQTGGHAVLQELPAGWVASVTFSPDGQTLIKIYVRRKKNASFFAFSQN